MRGILRFVPLSLAMSVSIFSAMAFAQPSVEFLGLEGHPITAMDVYNSVIAVGTNGDGVFYQYSELLPDSGWINIGLEGKDVRAVWLHYYGFGPYEGWGVTVGIFPKGDDSIYVYCSIEGGEFVPESAGISDSLAWGVYSIAGFPFTLSICGEKYAATGGALYRQLYGDTLWTPVYVEEAGEVIHVSTREDVGGLVLAGGGEGTTGILLIKSKDYGNTWEHISPPGFAAAFDFDADSARRDFQTIFVSHMYEISRSQDGGETWEIVYQADGCDQLSELIYEPSANTVLAAGGDCLDTTGAVLVYSGDLGETWEKLPLQMSGPVVGLAFGEDDYVYFAAPYSGVYRLALSELSTKDDSMPIPETFALYPPYPNPFNPTTTIEFSVPQRGLVTLTVYDLLGREVEMILSQNMDAGHHRLRWNASNVPSGIYFVRMQVGEFTQTRKAMVLR